MAIINQDKPTTSLANASKVSIGETWGSILTTWAAELRSWLAVSQLITNTEKQPSGYLWGSGSFPWLEVSPWDDVNGGMINVSKPS